jgi:uroporphyrinogen decarboxylase
MVEGKGSKNFSEVKKLIYNNPKLAHSVLDKLANTVADYLSAKIEAGCNAVQIFDTWGGILSQQDFEEFSLRYVEKIISQIKRKDEPIIFFAKGVHFAFDRMANSGADVLGLDWTMDLGKVREEVGDKVALQGNLDPTVLYANKNYIREETKRVLKAFGKGNGHVFNLGHGVLPDIDPENVKALVQFVKEDSISFHRGDAEAQRN